MKKKSILLVHERLKSLEGENGYLKALTCDSGRSLRTDFLFNLQKAVPNSSLASKLGVTCTDEGYIKTDTEQRTSIPFVYAAGDVTKAFAHQIVTAAHEGAMAGQRANYDLYAPEQRGE